MTTRTAKKPAKKAAKPKAKPKKPAAKVKPKKAPVKKPVKRAVKKKPAYVPPPPPPREKARCEVCLHKVWEDELRLLYGDHRCPNCRVFWYAVAVSPDYNEEAVAKAFRRQAKINEVREFKEVVVPRTLVEEVSKTTWRVWQDHYSRTNGWRIPEGETDPDVLREFGLLGIVVADTEDEARDAARRKFPNDFNRVVEPHSPGGKPRLVARVKFPGYVIVRCDYTGDVHHLIHSTRGVIGAMPLKPSLAGFRYPRKQPKMRVKPKKWEVEKHEEWAPVPLDTQAEVEALLEEKAAIKGTPRKLEHRFAEGTEVRVISGQWRDATGRVAGVSQETPPKVVVDLDILGRRIPTKFEGWQLIRKED